jgi:nitrile hydratase
MAKFHPTVDDYVVSRVRALESILLEKGVLAPNDVDTIIARYEADTGPLIGARMVARAWLDPAYRMLLLTETNRAGEPFGASNLDELNVVEDTPEVHNLVVCTLCSCYPWSVMGLPPTWYKMPPYRSRAVLEPRKLLAEMGWVIPPAREIRVWDSSAELRYMVLPERPEGSEGMSEDELAACVTRDALIGVEPVRIPARA